MSDGSKWIVGTRERVLSDGTITDSASGQDQIIGSFREAHPEEKVEESEPAEIAEITSGSAQNDEVFEEQEDDDAADATEGGDNGREQDIRTVKGIGAKSEDLLRSKNIHTVADLFDVINNNPVLLGELNKEIRGFNKIMKRVSDMMTLQNHSNTI